MVTLLPVIRPGRRETKVDSAVIRGDSAGAVAGGLLAPGLPGALGAVGVAVAVGFPVVPGVGEADAEGVGHGEGVGVGVGEVDGVGVGVAPLPISRPKKSKMSPMSSPIGPWLWVGEGLGAAAL